MKLTAALLRQTADQFEAQPIPDDHPLVQQLNKIYGDHTYFVDGDGLSIVERAESTGPKSARIVKLADWKDASRTKLQVHDPEPTDVVVTLDIDKAS